MVVYSQVLLKELKDLGGITVLMLPGSRLACLLASLTSRLACLLMADKRKRESHTATHVFFVEEQEGIG